MYIQGETLINLSYLILSYLTLLTSHGGLQVALELNLSVQICEFYISLQHTKSNYKQKQTINKSKCPRHKNFFIRC